MEIERLREFVCLAKTLNYHVAANRCYISHSALSKHILSMEKELGCRLFERNKAIVSLTIYGKLLLRRAEDIIGSYDTCLEELNIVKSDSEKSLSIGYMYEAAHAVLSELYKSIRTEHRDLGLNVNFKMYQMEEIKPRLDEGSIDVAIDSAPDYEEDPAYKTFPLYRDRLAVIVPPTHVFAKRESVSFDELSGHRLVVPSVAKKGFHSRFIKNAFGPTLLKEVKFEPLFSDPTEIPWYVDNGAGIAFACGFIYDELPDPGFVLVPVEGETAFNVSVIWKKQNETQALYNFLDILEQIMKSDRYAELIPPSASLPI